MKRKILLSALWFIIFSAGNKISFAQSNRAYAITGETQGNVNWTVVREVDLSTGNLLRNIYVPSSDKPLLLDASTGRQIISQDKMIATSPNPAVMIAAAAFDAKNNRLYFTTMQGLQLRYIDLSSTQLKIFYVQNPALKQFVSKPGEDDNITRMSFASDGFGYALTNNGEHFIRFSTDKNAQITDLGSLKDDVNNGEHSVHTQFLSWGGDLIGDAFNNLFLFTVKGSVLKINVRTLIASYVGTIKNLPEGFTVNAAAVDADGNVVVSSAINASDYYRVNLANLEAAPLSRNNDKVFNASDFANENFAYQKQANKKINVPVNNAQSITAFPNPVTNKNFTVVFSNSLKGSQNIQLTTINGTIVLSKVVDASMKTAKIILPQNTVPGTYILKVNTEAGNQVYSDKIVVQ